MNTACVDLDGVLAYYHEWKSDYFIEDPIPAGVEMVKRLRSIGFRIVVYSCRTNGLFEGVDYNRSHQVIKGWLEEHSIPYDKIATQHDGKPVADVYIDDRSITYPLNCNDMSVVEGIIEAVLKRSEKRD